MGWILEWTLFLANHAGELSDLFDDTNIDKYINNIND